MFVDLDVAVSRTLPLDRVTAIKDRIVTAVRGEFPTAEINGQQPSRARSTTRPCSSASW